MVDKAIQAAPVNIWDHTSHMREYLADPLLMPHRSDPPWKVGRIFYYEAYTSLITLCRAALGVDLSSSSRAHSCGR